MTAWKSSASSLESGLSALAERPEGRVLRRVTLSIWRTCTVGSETTERASRYREFALRPRFLARYLWQKNLNLLLNPRTEGFRVIQGLRQLLWK